jgi:hypothetical protein
MSGFQDMVTRDARQVFCNPAEFAETRSVLYDGVTYDGTDHQGIPVVLTKAREKDRQQLRDDFAGGLFRVNATLHCAQADLGGVQPEKGGKISLSEGDGFYYTYYIVTSSAQMGMVILELEAMDE